MHNSGFFSVYIYSSWKWIENWMHGKMIRSQVKNINVWESELTKQKRCFSDEETRVRALLLVICSDVWVAPQKQAFYLTRQYFLNHNSCLLWIWSGFLLRERSLPNLCLSTKEETVKQNQSGSLCLNSS